MIQKILHWLLPREDHFFGFLERQAVVAHDAAKAMQRYRDKASAVQVRDAVQDLEHKGDAIVHEMLDALARTFVTPIDREDLQRLSKRLDDILDYTNLAARACVLFGVDQPTKPMLILIDKLVQCTEVLKDCVPMLRKRAYNQLIEATHTLHSLEKEGDTVFRDAVSALFHDPAIDAKVILREKEVLDDLEKAINRCDSTAETIINVAVKHA
jgi:predicted phosphate transport protein (TIGR00153 family)